MDGIAQLRTWLDQSGRQSKDLAREFDVAPETVSRWLSGRLIPSMVVRIALEHVTGVSRDTWAASR